MADEKPADAAPPRQKERRSGKDRRAPAQPTKVAADRRRSIEPRKPEIVELSMSPSEWGALNDSFVKKPKSG